MSAAGILCDRKLGDNAYATYQYPAAIRAAGLGFTVVNTGLKIYEMPLVHFVCWPQQEQQAGDNRVDTDLLGVSTQARVELVIKIFTGITKITQQTSKLHKLCIKIMDQFKR